jgi:riboflavin kinase/FMN adenylyltransferase
MRVFRGFHHAGLAPACALTIGNFDGVHRGHQAMLALLRSEAQHRRLPATVMTFEPHPREFFAPSKAPARIATLRDKLGELERCGVQQAVVLRFDARFAGQSPQAFVDEVLVGGLGAKYVLVGDDFRFGARRAGDYGFLDSEGQRQGFDVARMNSYEVQGQRVSSSAVRAALAAGDMALAERLLGRPYAISGHVVHGQKLGRTLGFPTLNVRFAHRLPAASGIFVVRVSGLEGPGAPASPHYGVASLGVRPTVDDSGRVLLETWVFDWAGDAYGRVVTVELLHKLRDEVKYEGADVLAQLTAAVLADERHARAWLSARAGAPAGR